MRDGFDPEGEIREEIRRIKEKVIAPRGSDAVVLQLELLYEIAKRLSTMESRLRVKWNS